MCMATNGLKRNVQWAGLYETNKQTNNEQGGEEKKKKKISMTHWPKETEWLHKGQRSVRAVCVKLLALPSNCTHLPHGGTVLSANYP